MHDDNIRALARGFDVLRYLNRVGGDTGQSIAATLGLSRPTTYRILGTLEEGGLVCRHPEQNWYRLTRDARNLRSGLTDETWVLWIGTPILYELQEELLWPTDLATHDNAEMVIQESTHSISPYSIDVGLLGTRHSLLKGSVGRAYIGFCPENERLEILDQIRRREAGRSPAMSPQTIERLIQDTRTAGFGARQREINPKTSSIAVPIRYRDRVVACMSVTWIASAFPFEKAVQDFHPALSRACGRIEREMVARKDAPPIRRPPAAARRRAPVMA